MLHQSHLWTSVVTQQSQPGEGCPFCSLFARCHFQNIGECLVFAIEDLG